jgi:hypothetical protein
VFTFIPTHRVTRTVLFVKLLDRLVEGRGPDDTKGRGIRGKQFRGNIGLFGSDHHDAQQPAQCGFLRRGQ